MSTVQQFILERGKLEYQKSKYQKKNVRSR